MHVLTYADQVHEAIHAVADLEEDVPALPDSLRAESRPQQPGDAGYQKERAQEHGDDLHLLHQGDGDGLPLQTGERRRHMRRADDDVRYTGPSPAPSNHQPRGCPRTRSDEEIHVCRLYGRVLKLHGLL